MRRRFMSGIKGIQGRDIARIGFNRHCERKRSNPSPAKRKHGLLRLRPQRRKGKWMHTITLGRETDFDGWRKAARALALNDVHPSDVTWAVRDDTPEPSALLPEPKHGTFNVSAKFVELAKAAI